MSCHGEFKVSTELSHKNCDDCGCFVDSAGFSVEQCCIYSPRVCEKCDDQPCDKSC
jgi:hypothetical protein